MEDSTNMTNSTEPVYLVFGLVRKKGNHKVLAIRNKELKLPGKEYKDGEDERVVLKNELRDGIGIETDIRRYRMYGKNTIQIEGRNHAVKVYQIDEFSGEPKGIWVNKEDIPLLTYIQKSD